MKTKDRILELLHGEESHTATWLAEQIGISKQAVSRHLGKLIRAGLVSKEGRTKGARFSRFDPERGRRVKRKLATSGLQEDRVFREMALLLNLKEWVNDSAFSILGYAFTIGVDTRREIDGVFQEYGGEEFDYRFERTRVQVKLFRDECVSRSVARRLVARLDEFSEVILDFKGVDSIGQGFADEVFRVFLDGPAGVRLKVVNLAPGLRPMIEHVMTIAGRERMEFEAIT